MNLLPSSDISKDRLGGSAVDMNENTIVHIKLMNATNHLVIIDFGNQRASIYLFVRRVPMPITHGP